MRKDTELLGQVVIGSYSEKERLKLGKEHNIYIPSATTRVQAHKITSCTLHYNTRNFTV